MSASPRTAPVTCSAVLALAVAWLAGCGRQSTPRLPERAPDVHGTVTRVEHRPAGERLGVVRIEADPAARSGSAKANVTVTEATRILRQADATRVPARFDDLATGQTARAWFTGPVAESYPVQATAEAILILP